MFHGVLFLVSLSHLPNKLNFQSVCVPNTYFALNGRVCFCNHQGRWTDDNCKTLPRRQSCESGQIIWQGCKQCICKNNSELQCTSAYCYNTTKSLSQSLSEYSQRCTPFQSYYVNCSLCICSASGISSDAKCTIDKSCKVNSQTVDIATVTKMKCIPSVMYLFPCVQCLCSENGDFVAEKCLEKCQFHALQNKCIAGTIYRNDCNVCRCPNNGVPNMKVCTNVNCNNSKRLNLLRSGSNQCIPYTFTAPKCLYCDCLNGTVNENSCLELDCSITSAFQYNVQRESCITGELVPMCMECFCFNNGLTNATYCTRNCSSQSKLNILEKVLKDKLLDHSDKSKVYIGANDTCKTNQIYYKNGSYCICPENNKDDKNKLCISLIESNNISRIKHSDDLNCEPNTFVNFDCNTCYCFKNGKIDPKWCTYDDCEAKKKIQESHKLQQFRNSVEQPNETCVPGSISKVKCNFCICTESGRLADRACTKNICFDNFEYIDDKFTCEPLTYYEVDCNVCYCPHDGLKNVDKCTSNKCEKSFLRSNNCVPGQLFSDECKVCVCPRNGNKADKVCTNSTCGTLPWNTIELSPSLLKNQVREQITRKLDLCFPGEEFAIGCDFCVCPDLGLKIYATCEPLLCDEKSDEGNVSLDAVMKPVRHWGSSHRISQTAGIRVRREIHEDEDCFTYNISHSAERTECTPGSMYIIRCMQCICPYVGNINNFCRPLPKSFFCEEAFPGFNYLSMGRRNLKNATNVTSEVENFRIEESQLTLKIKHLKHTLHKCHKTGKITDECYVCECENEVIIEEHCYKNDDEKCVKAKPTFLNGNKVEN
ncbi:uncharacterized protein LOC124540157 isoform X2 [Vanessa cardui]|uniref:uncharacterized protein LOC124540157 isoform X2 n=1 Tax=Vanessa cardui TaxID=171605 RepID=UPI001F12ED18|nr:uncharacterized protein LOC124540157 isoform X2 [Vanessa cardui]